MSTIKSTSKKPVKSTLPKIKDNRFLIVGLGASAGGLEAFEQFFRHVPSDSGLAFVLVSHLDPSHASILTEILQRSTVMPVVEAQDQMKVAPNCVNSSRRRGEAEANIRRGIREVGKREEADQKLQPAPRAYGVFSASTARTSPLARASSTRLRLYW